MKKFLPLCLMAIITSMSSWAVTDGQAYAKVNGIGVKNLWIFDRVHAKNAYTESPICHTNARTATMTGGVIYVSRSQEKQVIIGNDTIIQGVIHCFDAITGEQTKELDLTLNGEPYSVFLGNTSIGCDNFGHIWVAPMTSAAAIEIPIYQVDIESGEMTLVTNMSKGDVKLLITGAVSLFLACFLGIITIALFVIGLGGKAMEYDWKGAFSQVTEQADSLSD